MVNLYISIGVLLLCAIAEFVHWRRTQALSSLAFGPEEKPRSWTYIDPIIKPIAAGALCWGLLVLLSYKGEPEGESAEFPFVPKEEVEHVMIILDVSPSMYIKDSGENGLISRKARAKELLESMMDRITSDNVKFSMVATFTGALPVVIDTSDRDVITNILELPMDQGFKAGKTNLLSGIEKAFEIAKGWEPDSCTCILISDGYLTAEVGMPTPPASVKQFIAAGVGSSTGDFIDGHQSRQDALSLKRIATRLRGDYEDANMKHISTKILGDLAGTENEDDEEAGLKEIALWCCGLGAFWLAILPVLLNCYGFNHKAGREVKRELKVIKGN